jgi:hypothetical protein
MQTTVKICRQKVRRIKLREINFLEIFCLRELNHHRRIAPGIFIPDISLLARNQKPENQLFTPLAFWPSFVDRSNIVEFWLFCMPVCAVFWPKCYGLREEGGESLTLKTKSLKSFYHSRRYVSIF